MTDVTFEINKINIITVMLIILIIMITVVVVICISSTTNFHFLVHGTLISHCAQHFSCPFSATLPFPCPQHFCSSVSTAGGPSKQQIENALFPWHKKDLDKNFQGAEPKTRNSYPLFSQYLAVVVDMVAVVQVVST